MIKRINAPEASRTAEKVAASIAFWLSARRHSKEFAAKATSARTV
jgi:hypothetical protein